MAKKTTSAKMKMDAMPDRVDIRDFPYQPMLQPLPNECVNIPDVPFILDQGEEGACTGFAMAAVVNFHLARKIKGFHTQRKTHEVSPRMLYEMARKYDEWPGEKYEGSSARGTIKGWVAHGVCKRANWKDSNQGSKFFTYELADEAGHIPGGAYYRVAHKQVRDMHAALAESGILFATSMVHDGWDEPDMKNGVTVSIKKGGRKTNMKIPLIIPEKRAPDGHAFAIVGYTREGFIIQNSWGPSWGNKGFALVTYDDWIRHATDCWVVQLGVPINSDVIDIPVKKGKRTVLVRSSQTVALKDIRPFVVDIGNNGKLSDTGDYWTTKEDIEYMFTSIGEKTSSWKKKRLMLYLHGGLNSEKEVAQRIVAFKDIMLKNEIYPVHIMWETGVWESLKSGVFDLFTGEDERAGAALWNKIKDSAAEARDRIFELTTSAPGTLLWDEMKENAELASVRADGGMKILCEKAMDTFKKNKIDLSSWELHVVAHSAGSIFAAHGLKHLLELQKQGLVLSSIHFMAPAVNIETFNRYIGEEVKANNCTLPQLYILSDERERSDTVSMYGKSLLYLVSNAFEEERHTHILGMEKFVPKNLYANKSVNGFPAVVIADKQNKSEAIDGNTSCSETHGGFDNDASTLNSILMRILGKRPSVPFTSDDLTY